MPNCTEADEIHETAMRKHLSTQAVLVDHVCFKINFDWAWYEVQATWYKASYRAQVPSTTYLVPGT